ncbi:unnamed protein product [Brassicogethes aeneus]|uniref:Protein smoothened n=1 Tax=Brassicogethes aeneus TaxID=1431903 RepID=A0A9P0FR77_BRAAE|nr:unnamed protein product [Brassicogethes aeneus]
MRCVLYLIVCVSVVKCRSLSEDNDEEFNKILPSDRSPFVKHRATKKEHIYFDKFNPTLKYCRRPAVCQSLNYTSCMGAKLPYHSTTLNLTDLSSQEKVQEKLQFYQYIRFIPKCWAVIQPFLCALYMPKCEKNMVDLPSREMCKVTLEPCKILYNTSVFPEFLNCEDEGLFPRECKNDIHDLKFNTTGYCMEPLTKTDHPDWYYPDVEGCGLKCKDSLYTENEHYQIHKLIAYCVLICIILNLFTSTTFIIGWKTANKYPALAIFYVNACFCISYFGWLIQFLGNDTREDIVCKKDGTLRKSEPSASENLSCVIIFFMIYYFFVAGLVWFVIFSYAWHMSSLQALGKIQERVDKKRAYFHLVAWSLPLILTITTMAIGEIDGDYVTGICFVGFVNRAARTGLLLAPLAAAMLVSGYIIVKGLILLVKVKMASREIISEHSSRKIRSNIVRMGVFTVFMVIFCLITFGYHHYISVNSGTWTSSLNTFIMCKLTSLSTDHSHCKQESRPSVAMLQLQLLAVFGSGIAMASWVWCDATLHSWGRYIRKKFNCEQEEHIKLQKHKIIAQAFAKRKIFNEGGKISILCHNHTDPVGLHFEFNSAASTNELSTTWAANLPRLVNRRGAVPNEVNYSVSSNNQSIDSEVSLSVRHVSIESRRNSGDSQVSVQIAELKARRKVNGRRHRNRHNFRSNSRTTNMRKHGQKRESSTSLDSHLHFLNAITGCDTRSFGPNLNRRQANAGLDSQQINNLVNGTIFNRDRNLSEDENVSVTISESRISMKYHNAPTLDLNDQLMMNSLCKKSGVHIEEIHSTSEEETDYKDAGQEKRYSKSGRDSHSSKKSRRSKRSRKRYSSNSDSEDDAKAGNKSDSSSCAEIKQLVQSSLNSGISVGHERNRGSRQSKTSNDVAVQTNSHDINSYEMEAKTEEKEKMKNKKMKTNENRKNQKKYSDKNDVFDKVKKSKEKYKMYGSSEELKVLNDCNKKYDVSDYSYSKR